MIAGFVDLERFITSEGQTEGKKKDEVRWKRERKRATTRMA